MSFVVLTGGPHSGKSTLLHELLGRGFPVVEEVAISVIEELNQRLGVEEQIQWRRRNILEFERRVLEEQLRREEALLSRAARQTVFCDRGLWDVEAYSIFFDTPFPSDGLAPSSGEYQFAFVLDTIPAFEMRRETGRQSTYEESLRMRDLLLEVYRRRNIETHLVPVASIEERLSMILDHLTVGE